MNYHLTPNWSENVTETYEFRTTVFTSYSGREQRVAERLTPHRTVSFSTLLWDDRLLAFKALMHSRGADSISIADPARYGAVLSIEASIGATDIVVESAPWLTADMLLVLSDLDNSEFVGGEELTSVGSFSIDYDEDFDTLLSGVQIGITTPLTKVWPKGTVIRPAVSGRLNKTVTLSYVTDRVATSSITLEVNVPSGAPLMGSTSLGTFNSRPVLLASPNWAQPPSVTLSSGIEEVDYDRGIVKTFLPVEFYTKITQFNYADRSRDDIGVVLTLFNQMRGRQGEFYCPSWTTDMLPSGGIVSGSAYLTVVGSAVAETYALSTVETALAIKLIDGTWLFRKIISIIATDDPGPGAFSLDFDESFDMGSSGLFSKIEFDTVVGVDVAQSQIAMICWLNVCRFASDSLTIRWLNDDVGQAVVQIMALESLTPEA